MGLDDLNAQMQDVLEQIKGYFSDLDDQERYGWLAEGIGFVLVIVGVVLLFL
jgi:hypothetical protein